MAEVTKGATEATKGALLTGWREKMEDWMKNIN
jgi:hypothetical protein